ncbi:MAG TPA: fasciclin domain-containing protein [Puia sp.]|nr:fasciclin domain-containing protein [Puia sp.]
MRCISLLAVVFIFLLGACKKTNLSGPADQTLQQYFNGAAHYSLFNHALQKTHLDSLLGGTNPYTVFAANDSAMTRAGYTTAGIDSANTATLTGILLYHLVPGAIASTDIDLYQETFWTTADSSYPAYLEYNNFGFFYDGIPVVSEDNRMVNGIVQGIGSIARPPVGDMVTTINKTPALSDFSYVLAMAENVYNAGGYYNTVDPFASGTATSPISVFLPDNSYYAAQGLDSYTAIAQSNGGGPEAFMTAGSLFTSDFIGKNAITLYYGTQALQTQLWFSIDGYSFVVESPGYMTLDISTPCRIVQANIVTTTGIIHIIEPNN